jgi:hypothetical protein
MSFIHRASIISLLLLSLVSRAHAAPDVPALPDERAAPPPAGAAEPSAPPVAPRSVNDILEDARRDAEVKIAAKAPELAALAAAASSEAATIDEGDKLRTPDSPAFSLLGVSPTEIQKPTTPRALAVALSKFVTSDAMLEIPQSLAIEMAPFWFWSRDRLTYADYVAADRDQWWRNLSLSLATTAVDESGALSLGTGMRSHYAFDSGSTATCVEYDEQLEQLAGESALGAKDIVALRAAHTSGGVTDQAAFDADLRALQTIRAAVVTKAQKDLAKGLTDCAESGAARKYVLSFAAAMAWRFPSSQAENGDLVSQAYWATYSHKRGAWTFLGLGRIRFDEANRGWDGFLDLGARAIFSKQDYAAALEVIGRQQAFGTDVDDSKLMIRAALQVEYLIQEGTWLSVSFGKDFAAADAGTLFSLANLTTSFGDPQISR